MVSSMEKTCIVEPPTRCARSTDADHIRPTWPDIIPVALQANLIPKRSIMNAESRNKVSVVLFVHYRADTRAWVLFSRHTELAEYGCKVFHQVVDIFFSSPVKALKIDFFVFVHKQISESDRLDHSIGEIGGQKAIFL